MIFKKLLVAINILIVLALALIMQNTIFFARVNPDAGYYLSVAARIYEGWIPFKDLAIHYTPLASYIFALVKWLAGGSSNYEWYIGTLLLFEIGSAILFYLCALTFIQYKSVACFASLVMLASLIANDGTYIVLEPFVIFFALLAFHIILRSNSKLNHYSSFSAGIFSAFAFLSKQYGLAVIAPFLFLLVFSGGAYGVGLCFAAIRSTLVYLVGFTIPIILVLSYFNLCHDIELRTIFHMLSGTRYPNFAFQFDTFSNFLTYTGIILLPLPLLLLSVKCRRDVRLLTLIIFILVFSLPLYVNQYPHYFMLLIPFVLLTAVYMLKYFLINSESYRALLISFVLATMFLSAVWSLKCANAVVQMNSRVSQIRIAEQIKSIVIPGSKVFALADPGLVYLCDFLPSDALGIGYSFPFAFTVREIRAALSTAQYVLLDRDNINNFQTINSWFTKESMGIESSLLVLNFKRVHTLEARFEIWERNPL